MQNEEKQLAKAKARLRATIEQCFAEAETDTGGRLKLVAMIVDLNAKRPSPDLIES